MKIPFTYTSPTGLQYAAEFNTVSRIIQVRGHGQANDMHFVDASEPLQLQATAAKVAAQTKNRQNRDSFMGS